MLGSLVSVALLVSGACPAVGAQPGTIVRAYEPVGRFAGHWGIDIAAAEGAPVAVVGDGVVTFAGSVAGRLSVTVASGSAKVSYSYLAAISVSEGQRVVRGATVGVVGTHGGRAAFHLSFRVDGRYRDPKALFACLGPPALGLRLAPSTATYPVSRVRNTRRHI
ncbi:MAG: M23 family metallopeptidase [Acidimicrobiia bacterium]